MVQCQGVVKKDSVGSKLIESFEAPMDAWIDKRTWSAYFCCTAAANA